MAFSKTATAGVLALCLSLSSAFSAPSPGVEERTPGGAMLRSMLWTAVPVAAGLAMTRSGASEPVSKLGGALVLGGAILGPSAGNLYLHDGWGTAIGVGARAIGATSMLASFGILVGCAGSDNEAKVCKEEALPIALFGGGLGIFIGGTTWNLVRLSKFHGEYSLVPTWDPSDKAYGARLALSY